MSKKHGPVPASKAAVAGEPPKLAEPPSQRSPYRLPAQRALARWWRREVDATVDYVAVVETVRADAGWSAHVAVMTLLSAGIAVLGLLLSSPAVVIGAMLISPLMGPIIGVGFALATFDTDEIRRALWAIFLGSLLAVAISAAIVLLSPIQSVTAEIAARTRPNLFDLMIALLSGLAGTYAVIRGRHGAIVGVAIATALMPPLAVMGFGLATGNWRVLSGSSLLFFTNLMTIAAAAAALARLYGFATNLSPSQTRLQAVMLVGSLVLLSIPLGLSLQRIAWEALATREAREAVAKPFGGSARVSDLQVKFGTAPLKIEATVLTPTYIHAAEQTVSAELQRTLGERVDLIIDQVRTSDGDASSVEIAQANHAAEQREASRLMREMAMLAGVEPDRVLIDQTHKMVEVRAAPLPGANLETYRELERRMAAAESGWQVHLVPPFASLPNINDGPDREQNVQTAAWAASRLGLPVRLGGSGEDIDKIEKQLRDAKVAVVRASGRSPELAWAGETIGRP